MSVGSEGARHEAGIWLARLQSRSISNAELVAFMEWRKEPGNAAAYREVEDVWERSAELEDDADIAAMVDAVSQPLGPRRRMALPTGGVGLAVACVALFGLLLFGLLLLPAEAPQEFRTVAGERATATLDDGTRVRLDAASRLTAEVTSRERNVTLLQGRVVFDVRHDPARAFVVDAGRGVSVRALGTRFDVRRLGSAVRVTVEEGRVEVRRSAELVGVLAAGHGVELPDDGAIRYFELRSAQSVGHRGANVSLRGASLEAAVAEMNRHSPKTIVVLDPENGARPVSGEFSSDDPAGFVRALNSLFGDGTVAMEDVAG